MRYIIDGYNLTFKSFDKASELIDKRKSTLQYLRDSLKEFNLDITVVFDGKGMDLSFETFDFISIVYTPENLSADEFILEMLSTSIHPSKTTIVSSDKSLVTQCKSFGSNTMSIQSFLKWVHGKNHKKLTASSLEGSFQDSPQNIKRLLKIFEKKYRERH